MHLDDENCLRYQQVLDDVELKRGSYLDEVDSDLELTLFPDLREIVGMPDASTDEMHNVCNYLYWAKASQM